MEYDVYNHCKGCDAVIRFGESHWAINVQKERTVGDHIEVESATGVASFCQACASRLDFGGITVPYMNGRDGLF